MVLACAAMIAAFPALSEFLADRDRIPTDCIAARFLSFAYRPIEAVIEMPPFAAIISRDVRHTVFSIVNRPYASADDLAQQIAPHEPPLPVSDSGAQVHSTPDLLPAPASGGGR